MANLMVFSKAADYDAILRYLNLRGIKLKYLKGSGSYEIGGISKVVLSRLFAKWQDIRS